MRQTGRHVGLAALGIVWTSLTPPSTWAEVFCAGNDDALWIVWTVVIPDQSQPVVRLGYTESDLESFRVPVAQPRVGTVRGLALRGKELHVFYGGGAHYRFSRRGDSVEVSVPADRVPLAVCGDAGRDAVFALLDRAAVQRMVEIHVSAEAAERTEETEAAGPTSSEAERERAMLLADPQARFWVVEYKPGRWRLTAAVPANLRMTPECWLAADGDQVHLAWRGPEEGEPIAVSTWADQSWSEPSVLVGTEKVLGGTLLALDGDPVFVAELPDPADAARRSLSPFLRGPTGWDAAGTLQADGGALGVLPGRFSVAAYRGELTVVVERGDDQEPVAVAFYAPSGGPARSPFMPVARLRPVPKSWLDAGWVEIASYVVLFAILILLFWRRQDSLLVGAKLDPGWSLVAHGRRVLAFLMDLVPVWIVTLPVWFRPLMQVATEWAELAQNPDLRQEDAIIFRRLWVPWLATRALYVAYCTVFETLAAATPGKMATRCSVRRLDGTRCGLGSILIRNLARFVELEPYLYIWPMLILVPMTRNHQRVGDLLARTVVVQYDERGDPTSSRPPGEGG